MAWNKSTAGAIQNTNHEITEKSGKSAMSIQYFINSEIVGSDQLKPMKVERGGGEE